MSTDREARAFTRLAVLFYGAFALAAWLWRSVWMGESLWYAAHPPEPAAPLRDAAAGALAAAVVILASRALTEGTRWGEALARALARAVGRVSGPQIAVLALASGIGEELFFRGALQPRVGLVVASLLFGLAHFVPRRELAPWTGFSVAAGFLLGWLFDATGNLLAPIIAHVAVNGVNLTLLVRQYGEDAPRSTPAAPD